MIDFHNLKETLHTFSFINAYKFSKGMWTSKQILISAFESILGKMEIFKREFIAFASNIAW